MKRQSIRIVPVFAATTLSILFVCASLSNVYAQSSSEYVRPLQVNFEAFTAVQVPIGELSNRFGTGFSSGLGFQGLLRDGFFGHLDAGILYGGSIKEDVLSELRTSSGDIVGIDKELALVTAAQRGWHSSFSIGKLIHLKKESTRHVGIRLSAGVGYLSHRIRIKDHFDTVPQLQGDYKKGYDRLSSGLMLKQFIGYQWTDQRGLMNLFGGFQIIEGFTKNQRDWDFPSGTKLPGNKMDVLVGLQVGFFISFDLKDSNETIFF